MLEGSVRRDGDRVRITAQLINAVDGYHLFSKSYDRELLNIFDTQDEIAETIARELQERFEPGTPAPAEGKKGGSGGVRIPASGANPLGAAGGMNLDSHFHDTEAYTEFLKGIHQFNQWTPESSKAAIRHFDESIRLDPTCALPYSGKATAYVFLAALGQMPGSLAYPQAKAAALKAMNLEEASGGSHAAMATVLFFHDWDFRGAYEHFQKALTLTPGAASLRRLYAMYLMAIGELEAAEEEMTLAVQMDPLSPSIRTALAEILIHRRRYEEAESELTRVLGLDPEFRAAREALGWSYIARGMFKEALQALEEIPRRTSDPFKVIPHRMWALVGMGQEAEARRLFRLLEERREREPEISLEVDFALAHMTLGEVDRTLDYLEASVDRRLGMVVFLNTMEPWEAIRTHPRFQELVRRVGLPDFDQESR